RVRGNRGRARDDPRRGARALSPCRQAIEGVREMNDDATLHDDELQEVARRLGARAAERLDVEGTAQAVVARLRTEPCAEMRVLGWIRPAWLRIAAMLVIVVGGGVVALNVRTSPHTTPLPSTSAGGDVSELSGDALRVWLEA